MDKKAEIVNMVEDVYVNCILDYLYVLVKDAHQVASSVQSLKDFPVVDGEVDQPFEQSLGE